MEVKASDIPAVVSSEDAGRLLSTMHDLLRTDESADAARSVCAAVRELVGADGATFVLREGDEVFYAEEDAVGALWKGRRFPASACISGWAVTKGETAIIEDIYDDPRIPVEAYRPTFVKSLCMTPASRERPIGAVGAYWGRPYRATEREVWLLEQLADAGYGVARRTLDEPRESTLPEGPLARLLAVVAHDLRQPLATISQDAELLFRETDGVARHVAERVARSAGHANELVNQILDLAQLEQQRVPLRLRGVPLDELCRDAILDLRSDGADIILELEPVRALLDADRVRQVVVNLVRNALQHGADGRPVRVRVSQESGHGRVEVHNEGAAIPVDRRDRILEPFARFEGGAGSIGLGLYIADQIVRAHGGRLELASTDADGTVFTAILPLAAVTLDVS